MADLKKRTILLYGRTNSGKTAQLGKLAEHVYKVTGGKTTRLYTADKGGTATVQPYIDLGIIDPVVLGEGDYKDSDPWIFLNKASQGQKKVAGKWAVVDNSKVGLFAFESMRSFAEALMSSMAEKAGQNISIGGGANISFNVSGDGESLKISGSNMAHFGVCQQRMTDEIWRSQKLDAPFILWTSSVSKDDDATAAGKVLGPDVIGKALTTEVPRWFDLTFRIDVLAAQQGKPERHILYLGNHVDAGAGNAAGLGNVRLPLDAPALGTVTIEPADIVRALQMLEGGKDKAVEAIKQRLQIKG